MLEAWLMQREGIAHRHEALRAGFSAARIRAFVRAGAARMIRRAWIALPQAPADLVTAAEAGGRVSCVSLAARRGWWMPEGVGGGIHLHLLPHAGSARAGRDVTIHWTQPLAPLEPGLVSTVEDALSQIAGCLPRDEATVLWESACKIERLAPEALRRVKWRNVAAVELSASVEGLSDSGLETLIVLPLRRSGLRVRQQVVLAGRPVDALIGDRLVVQVDGYEFHSSSAQRSADIAHDAELRLRGYTVLRFSYHQVVRDRPAVERVIRRAVAAGLHLA